MPNPPTRPLSLDDALDAYRTQAKSFQPSATAKGAAFTAAATAALALAPSADAAIQYSQRQDILIDLRTDNDTATPATAEINLNATSLFTTHALADEVLEFSFKLRTFFNGDYNLAEVVLPKPNLGASVINFDSFPARLNSGINVSGLGAGAPGTMRIVSVSGFATGNWFGGTMSFDAAHFLGVGFKIPNGSVTNTHFGWIRVGIATNALGQPVAMTIYDWAWEDSPNTAIETGATITIPEPSPAAGLALLAAGAAGIAAWRRRKQPTA